MEVSYTVETTNGKVWKATCSDPSLEIEGPDIISVSKSMAEMIEKWFITTFNTKKTVVVEVPIIKAKIKATISVRSEKSLCEFEDENSDKHLAIEPPKNKIACHCKGCGIDIVIKEGSPMLCESCTYEQTTQPKTEGNIIDGPCMYLSDGKGVLPVGMCEAVSDDPSDTPGIQVDMDGTCKGTYEACTFYKSFHDGGKPVPNAQEPIDEDTEEIDDSEWD